jgi:hypothetical protein
MTNVPRFSVTVLYHGGSSGWSTGEQKEGHAAQCAHFLLDLDTESGQHDPQLGKDHVSLNDWTAEELQRKIELAADKFPIVLDRKGDHGVLVVVTTVKD